MGGFWSRLPENDDRMMDQVTASMENGRPPHDYHCKGGYEEEAQSQVH